MWLLLFIRIIKVPWHLFGNAYISLSINTSQILRLSKILDIIISSMFFCFLMFAYFYLLICLLSFFLQFSKRFQQQKFNDVAKLFSPAFVLSKCNLFSHSLLNCPRKGGKEWNNGKRDSRSAIFRCFRALLQLESDNES